MRKQRTQPVPGIPLGESEGLDLGHGGLLLEAVTAGTEALIAVVDLQLRYTFFNRVYQEEMRRLSDKDVQLGDSVEEVFAHMPRLQAIVVREWKQALQGESCDHRIELGDAGRHRRIYSVRHTPIRDTAGHVVGAGEVTFDVTERVRMEQALRASEERVRLISDHIPGGATYQNVTQPDGTVRYTYISAGVEKIFGLTPESVMADATAFRQLVVEEDWPRVSAAEQEALRDATPFDCEFRWRTVAGDIKWVHCRSTAHRQEDGSILWNGVIIDITSRKQVEAEARAQQIRLSMALEVAGMVNYEWDIPTGSIRYFDNLPAIVRGETVAPYCSMDGVMPQIHPEDRARLAQALDQTIKQGTPFECEVRTRMLDGTYRWILSKGKIVQTEGGKPARVLGISMDITERKRAEEALRRSEALYRAIGESIDYGVWVCAPDGRNTYTSESFLKLVGFTQEQCSNFGWGAVLHPEDAERTIAAWKECCRTGGTWDIEHRYRGVDGQYHAVLARGVPVKDEAGKVVCWAGINLDISRLKRAQEATRASEARFRLLADTAGRLLATQDPQGVVNQLCRSVMAQLDCQVFCNYLVEDGPVAASQKSEVRGQRLRLNACGGIAEEETRRIERLDHGVTVCGCVARDGQSIVAEDIQHSEDQRTTLVKSYGVQAYCCHPLLAQGHVIGTLSFGTTTRPRFRAEEVELMRAVADQVAVALRRRQTRKALEAARAEAINEKNRLAAVMETLPVGVSILDAHGGLVRANAAYDQIWGGPRPPTRDVRDYDAYQAWGVDTGNPVQPEEWASARAVQHGETVVNQELQIQRFDGTRAFVLNSAAPIRDAEDRIIGCAVAMQDITDRKRAEELQRRLEHQMQQAQKYESLGVMAGGIAHDFNNLLAIVMGNLGLLSEDMPADSPARRHLDRVAEASRRAAELCQHMLAYAGKTPLSFCSVQLNRLLQDLVRLIAGSLSKQAQLRWNPAEPLPLVHADPSRLRQIVTNLLLNASEAIGDQPGQITLATGSARCTSNELQSPWLQELLPAGDYVFLEVADTGCGIEAAKLSRVFDPFFSTKFTGRGLGLASVLGIVRSHHGTIQVQSAPGRGSTFRVWLPAGGGEPAVPTAPAAPARPWRGSGTVLVVDDEEGIRSTAKQMLERLGFEAVTAADGLEALKIYRADPDRFWCVLLDITMPQLSGEATFRELVRARETVRVVLSSGYARDEIMANFAGRSVSGFLQKPYTLENLATVLHSLSDTPSGSGLGPVHGTPKVP